MSYSNVHLTGQSYDPRYFGVNAKDLAALQERIESTQSGKCYFTYQDPTSSSSQNYFFDASPLINSSDIVDFFGNSGRLRKDEPILSSTNDITKSLKTLLKTNPKFLTHFYKPLDHSHVYMRGETWGNFETIKPSFRAVQNATGEHVVSVYHLKHQTSDTRVIKFGGLKWDDFDVGATEPGVVLEFGEETLLVESGHNFKFKVPVNDAHVDLILRQYYPNLQSQAKYRQKFGCDFAANSMPITVEAVYDDPKKSSYLPQN